MTKMSSTRRLKKNAAPPPSSDDDSSVDSKGNLKGFIAYSEDEDDKKKGKPKTARYNTRSKKEAGKIEKRMSKMEIDDEKPPSRKSTIDETYRSPRLGAVAQQKKKKRRAESSSSSSSSYSADSDEEDEFYGEGSSDDDEETYDSAEDSDYDEEEEEEEERMPSIMIIGGGQEDDHMVPKRHNMKKESEIVRKFVDLVTKSPDENTIDNQIDMFKGLTGEQQRKVIDVLENRASNPHILNPQESLMFKIMTMNLPAETQGMVLNKYQSLQMLDPGSSEYFKNRAWLDKLTSLPLGYYKSLPVRIGDGSEACMAFMERAKRCLNDAIYGQEEAKLQILQYIAAKIANPEKKGTSLILAGPPGIGKCHAKDTPILMADGSIKLVQDIVIDDYIMGDDSKPRKVLSLGQGQDILYDIIPTKGETYRVNSEHILCLKQSGKGVIKPVKYDNITYKTIRIDNKKKCLSYKSFKTYEDAEDYLNSFTEEDNIIEISVKDYLKLPKEIRDGWLKGYRKGVEFPYVEPDFDPYIIGLWLGDGSSSDPQITSQDAEIISYLQKTLPLHNLMLQYYSKYDYGIRAITTGKKDNIFLQVLKKYNMLNNKHIPTHFKCNSRDIRLKVLAGLVDTDGYVNNNTIEIIQKSDIMCNDILYLARSLGFAAYNVKKSSSWTYKGVKNTGIYNRITISGNIDEIPIHIKRKIPDIRLQKKDVLVTGFTIKEVGYGDYYGFTLDGNHRYLMGDFTVTHNTELIKNGIAKAFDWPFQFISLGGDSDASTYTGHQLVYESSHCGKIVNSLISAKSMSMILMFDEVDKISATPKGEEVQHLLIHLTDPVQNEIFEDKYLAGIPLDLGSVLYVFSANDIGRLDRILLDRMTVIQLAGYNAKEKLTIAEQFLLPKALDEVGLKDKVGISKEILQYIIEHYAGDEPGVRELKRCMEQLAQKINMLRMFNSADLPFHVKDFKLPFIMKKEHVELFLKRRENRDKPPMGMYI